MKIFKTNLVENKKEQIKNYSSYNLDRLGKNEWPRLLDTVFVHHYQSVIPKFRYLKTHVAHHTRTLFLFLFPFDFHSRWPLFSPSQFLAPHSHFPPNSKSPQCPPPSTPPLRLFLPSSSAADASERPCKTWAPAKTFSSSEEILCPSILQVLSWSAPGTMISMPSSKLLHAPDGPVTTLPYS